MYTNSPKFKSCYEKLRKSHKKLNRRVKGRLSPSAKAARDAAQRSIHNKCIKKLKLKVPLLKPTISNKSRRKSKNKSRRKRKSKSRRKRKSKSRRKSKRKRNDGSDVVKDVSWISYYKRYYNDPTFDVKRIDWTGYQGRLPAGSKIRVSRKSKK
jgi:hypothetical protein